MKTLPYFFFSNLTYKVFILFFFIHIGFIGLFWFYKVPELFYFNIGSSLLYVLLMWMHRARLHNLSFTFLTLEVAVHATLCSHLLGDAGFSAAILFLPMIFFLHPCHTRYKILYFLGILAVYLALVFHDQLNMPYYLLGKGLMTLFNMSTSLLIISIGSYIAYYTFSAIKEKEAMLHAENEKLQEQYELVEKLSITDGLTSLFNRAKLEADIKYAQKLSARTGQPFSLVLLDIDHFKGVNDTYGHQVGDDTLKVVANTLKNTVRGSDIAGRWGGEEFIVLCPDTPVEGAKQLALKLKKSIASADFGPVGKKTASFGVSQLKSDENWEEALSRADRALYRAKDSGRNRVEVSQV